MVKAETLRRFDILASLTDEELAELAQLCQEESHAAGELLFSEGDPAEKFYLVLEGKISLEKRIQLGRHGTPRQATVSIAGPGRAMAWSALVQPHIMTLSGVCLEPSRVLAVEAGELQDFTRRMPHAGRELMHGVSVLIATRLEDMTATLTYFLSIVSHELKAPLAAVQNYLQVMHDGFTGELTEKQKRMVQRSILRINDLTVLINDLLDLARMRPEQIRADFVRYNPREAGDRSVEDVRLAAAEKDITLKVIAPERFEDGVGAPGRLRQVLTNLLTNAIKFSPQGSTVTLRSWQEGNKLYAEVSDEGMGIPPDDQPHIFEDFYRARNVQDKPGAGLGLSIAKKIVEAHEGRIWVESPYEEGRPGTRFTFYVRTDLPLPGGVARDTSTTRGG